MKKTFPVNINGKIFYIDEDAYRLLLDYLSQLRATFTGDEGAEIVDDIESRISEHFDERIRIGANVIAIEDVNHVIETMGRPDQLSEDGASPGSAATDPVGDPSVDGDARPQGDQSVPPSYSNSTPPPPPIKKLYRDERHSVFGGVIAGLAQYLGWDVTVMRILAVIITILTYFWPCVFLYLIAWMVIPVARTPREILEMQGRPVTLDTIGQTVINNSVPPVAPAPNVQPSSVMAFINTFFSIAAKFILGFFAVIFGICAMALIGLILVAIVGILLMAIAGIPTVLNGLDLIDTGAPILEASGYLCLFFSVLIPLLIVVRYSCMLLFDLKAPSKSTLITAAIFEVLFIIGAIALTAVAREYPQIYIETSEATLSSMPTISSQPLLPPSILAVVPAIAILALVIIA